jgi:hypothetical protein
MNLNYPQVVIAIIIIVSLIIVPNYALTQTVGKQQEDDHYKIDNIWLNERFANLCEALYWEDRTKNFDEYYSLSLILLPVSPPYF